MRMAGVKILLCGKIVFCKILSRRCVSPAQLRSGSKSDEMGIFMRQFRNGQPSIRAKPPSTPPPNKPKGKRNGKQKGLPFYLDRGFIMKAPEQKDDKPLVVCRRIEIEQIRRDIEKETVTLLLSYDYMGKSYRREISRNIFTRSKLLPLQEYGVDVMDDPRKIGLLLHYLHWAEEHASLINTHENLGFGEVEGELIFKLHQAVGYNSVYNGPLAISPQGSLEGWLDTINQQVIGHVPLEFALTLGLAAPTVALLARDKVMDVLIIHIYGDSTQGKSTACALAVSPFGSPNIREDGLVKTWNGTENAVFALLRGVHGVPVVLDEASTRGSGDYTSFIYSLASGKEKRRLDREGRLRPGADWSGAIISNAEHSLKIGSKQNTGLEVRLMEIANRQWTKSAEHADAILEGIYHNYGHAGATFVAHIMNLGPANVRLQHHKWCRKIVKKLAKFNGLSDRLAGKIAVFPVTAQLANDALGLELDVDAICKFAVEAVAEEGRSESLSDRAYQHFLDSVNRFRKFFSANNSENQQAQEHWGRLCYKDGQLKEIEVDPSVFNKLMKEGGFEDAGLILKGWSKSGLLNHDPGKLTRKRAIAQGIEPRVYVVRIDGAGESGSLSEADEDLVMVKPPKHRRLVVVK